MDNSLTRILVSYHISSKMVRQFALCRPTPVRSEQFSACDVTVKRRECDKSRQFIRGGMDRLTELVHDVHAGAALAEE